MAARISTRISIKWAGEQVSEPTDTLVLSLGGYYVDLRILKADDSIDWALAGQRIVISEQPQKVKFTHSINSHAGAPGEVQTDEDVPEDEPADIGQFSKLQNGDDFETGEMAAPHLGREVTPYEEVWRQFHPDMNARDPFCPDAKAWILESKDYNGTRSHGGRGESEAARKTFLARVGPFFIAIRRGEVMGNDTVRSASRFVYGAIRQEFDATSSLWVSKYSVGDHTDLWTLSSGSVSRIRTSEAGSIPQVNDVVELGEEDALESYIVRAIST